MSRLSVPTRGGRIAAWLFPALTYGLALNYLLADPRRLSSPAFDGARHIMPMHVWGVVFLVTATVKVVCLMRGSMHLFIVAMCFGMGLYAAWAWLFFVSVLKSPDVSPGAPMWPMFVVGMHLALLSTLKQSRG